MKNSKFSEVHIIKILSKQNQSKTVNEICREYGHPTDILQMEEQIWWIGCATTLQNEGTGRGTFTTKLINSYLSVVTIW